jgi:cytochrome c oxidase cbb3-type subunit 3
MSNIDENKLHQGEPEIDELTNDRYLGGHEYDGIRELDNKLPRWWVYLFYATIIFSVVYMLGYHVVKTEWVKKAFPLQEEEYNREMTSADAIKKANPEPTVDLATMIPLTDATDLAAGEATYKQICIACHGPQGQGLVGPNFTDEYWIHGDSITNTISIKNLYNVVVTGVIEKGMIPYKDQLSPAQIQQVCSYILTMQGTNPPNPKAPQGAKYGKIG